MKYLPGNATPYKHIRQLTPNTRISFPEIDISRYWPRSHISGRIDGEEAANMLEEHLTALRDYLRSSNIRPILGITAGTDSRGLFAALHSENPYLFTWVRSSDGKNKYSEDTYRARLYAEAYGLKREIIAVKSKTSLTDVDTALARAFRQSTSYYRGNDSGWLHSISALDFDPQSSVLIRGFGGEILRGFYQYSKNAIDDVDTRSLSRAYDVLSGSRCTREMFSEFIETTDFRTSAFYGRDINDMFYWEHRMGTWGAVAMSEADLAIPSLVGYNSRNLYDKFLALPLQERAERKAFKEVTRKLAPRLEEIAEQ